MGESAAVPLGWERTALAVEKVKERLRRACSALAQANVPYAVVGDHAVAEWVGRADESAVRNTRDEGVLLRRADFGAAKLALETMGFVHAETLGADMFLDGPEGGPRDAVHVVFAGEKVHADHPTPAPDVAESETGAQFQVVALGALVRMKLNAFRLKDQVHLLDMIEVGLIDASWPARFPEALGKRLQYLPDHPNI